MFRNMKMVVLALAMASVSAHADTARIVVSGAGSKFNGVATVMVQPTDTTPAQLSFTQTVTFPIGQCNDTSIFRDGFNMETAPESSCGAIPAYSMPWSVSWTKTNGTVVVLTCQGQIPSFDGTNLHYQLWCDAQP